MPQRPQSRFPRHLRALVPAVALLLTLAVSACSGLGSVTTGQQGGGSTTGGQSGSPTATTGGQSEQPTAAPTTSAQPTPTNTVPPAQDYFVWTAQAGNITNNWTSIDNPHTNGQPNAIVMVTPRYNPNNVYDNHPIGVWYHLGKWTIFHQDVVAMIPGASFNVKVYSGAGTGLFTWTATAGSITNNWTTINSTATNGNAGAVLLVTPIFGSTSVYDNHPIGVWYTGSNWTIFNQDLAPMPANAMFNVALMIGPAGQVFVATASSGNITNNWTTLNDPDLNGLPNAILLVTPDYGSTAVYDNHNIGVWYNAFTNKWTIYNQDKAAMPSGAMFTGAVFGS
jgi:hypothetical protein